MVKEYVERCYAGWLGKTIGVRHGAPIEGWSYASIRQVCGEIEDYPMEYHDFAADDDTNGPLFFLRALEDYGLEEGASCARMGDTWQNYIPWEHGMLWWGGYGVSTEHTAFLNLWNGIPAPESGSSRQNGVTVAEQIGGQIFSEVWGLICPGDPAKAAHFAQLAAQVSHDGEAVNGGRFVAAAVAAAFEERDIYRVLHAALQQIPEDSLYRRMAGDIEAYWAAHKAEGWRGAMEYIIAHWGYDRYGGGCHVIPNSAVMIMSMLYGGGDFSRTINICNMCGWDTDCNVGSVGAIMGVLVGLDGIAEKWTRPIHDFMVSSSAVGCLNITTLPDFVRRAARLAYAIAGEEIPEKWREFLSGAHFADFALPRSTWSFRLRGEGDAAADELYHEDSVVNSGNGALRVHFRRMRPGEARYAYYGTYYHAQDFTDSRYDPAFSPVVYPGQRISLCVRAQEGAALKACAFALDDNAGIEHCGEEVLLQPGEWAEVSLEIPALDGGRISQTGVKCTRCGLSGGDALLYIDHMDVGGRADYTLDFAREAVEYWPRSRHCEITQLTRWKGHWTIESGMLHGSCADRGEAYTGDIAWRDGEITCRWTPVSRRGRSGFGVRTQGAIRGYAVLADAQHLYLMKNEKGYSELARCARPAGETLEITVRYVGDSLEAYHEGNLLMRAKDAAFTHGMAGFLVQDGAHAAYAWLKVRVL